MRSTRATAAVARLNSRSAGQQFRMVLTGSGLFILRERIDGVDKDHSTAIALDDFVRLVDSMGPKTIPRTTKNEAAFMKQLVKKDPS
jgi:hypothetical protein